VFGGNFHALAITTTDFDTSRYRVSKDIFALVKGRAGLLFGRSRFSLFVQEIRHIPFRVTVIAAGLEDGRVHGKARRHHGTVVDEIHIKEWQAIEFQCLNDWGSSRQDLDEMDRRPLASESQSEAIGRPGNRVNPGLGMLEFAENLAEFVLISPHFTESIILRRVHTLDVRREDTTFEIARARHDELVVRAPCQSQHS